MRKISNAMFGIPLHLLAMSALVVTRLTFAGDQISSPNSPPVMPSDSAIQKAMTEKRADLDKRMNEVRKIQPKPLISDPKSLTIPDFMIQHGYSTLARDSMIEAQKIKSPTHNRRSLMLALTLTMPETVLREYAKQVAEVNARIILRGVPKGYTVPQVATIIARINHGHNAEWSIDPPLFRRFKLTKVPALLLVDDESAQKLENQCAPPLSFLEVDGEVSIRQALSIMEQDHSNLGLIAEKKLKSLEGRDD